MGPPVGDWEERKKDNPAVPLPFTREGLGGGPYEGVEDRRHMAEDILEGINKIV